MLLELAFISFIALIISWIVAPSTRQEEELAATSRPMPAAAAAAAD